MTEFLMTGYPYSIARLRRYQQGRGLKRAPQCLESTVIGRNSCIPAVASETRSTGRDVAGGRVACEQG